MLKNHYINEKLNYIYKKILNIKNIQILELGVQKGKSTKKFLKLINKNKGKLISVDINDCSKVSKNKKWKFIHSSDDNFKYIDKFIKKNLDVIFIDSLHEPNHVIKIFYHYYKFLKKGGLCFIDDISWLPYVKNSERDNDFSERINRMTFNKILEMYHSNRKNVRLEFSFLDSGIAVIKKLSKKKLLRPIYIIDRSFTIKNLLKKIYAPKPKN